MISFMKEDKVTRLVSKFAMQYNDGYNETISVRQQHQQPRWRHAPERFKTSLTGTINRYALKPIEDDIRPAATTCAKG